MLNKLFKLLIDSPDVFHYKLFLAILFLLIIAVVIKNLKQVVFVDSKTLTRLLSSTICYITLPIILFLLSLPINLPLKIGATIIVLFYCVKALQDISSQNIIADNAGYHLRIDLFSCFFGLLIISYASLFWGYGFFADWEKHRSVLVSIFYDPFGPKLRGFNVREFDKTLQLSMLNTQLVYYYAMYLPCAHLLKLVTLLINIKSLKVITLSLSFLYFIWNLLGIFLASLLLPLFSQKILGAKVKSSWGLCYLILLISAGYNYWIGVISFQKLNIGHSEWIMPYFAQYTSFISLWQWVPSQLIVGFLGITILGLYQDKFAVFPLCIWSAFLLSSSVYCWLGSLLLLPFLFYSWLKPDFKKNILTFFTEKKTEIALTFFITMIILLFYLSKQSPESFTLNKSLFAKYSLLRYLCFLLIELTPFILILSLGYLNNLTIPTIIWPVLGILVVLPLFQTGLYNDLVMRVSIPAMLILMIYCAMVIQEKLFRTGVTAKIFLAVFFLAAIPNFTNEIIVGLFIRSNPFLKADYFVKLYAGTNNIFEPLFSLWQKIQSFW